VVYKKGIDQMVTYCNKWNLQCNLNKTKVMLLRKGGKQKSRECWWYMYCPRLEVVKVFIYLGVKLESLGEWRRHNESMTMKGQQSFKSNSQMFNESTRYEGKSIVKYVRNDL
jgi:hypothetical protein